MTRLAARLGAMLAASPGRPSIVETASLAMFSIVGYPPLVPFVGPPAGVELAGLDPERSAVVPGRGPVAADHARGGAPSNA